jgi:hypothetical protein
MLRGRNRFSKVGLPGAFALALCAVPAAAQSGSLDGATIIDRVLRAHNAERDLLGLQALTWDSRLALAASAYASELAATDKWEHAPQDQRAGQGENLWMGSRGAFSFEEMVGAWLSEKRMFRAGAFPHVSTSGSWTDVGHYTQIIWHDTSHVGCGVRSSASYDYLVCRYSAPGNVIGQRVGATATATR